MRFFTRTIRQIITKNRYVSLMMCKNFKKFKAYAINRYLYNLATLLKFAVIMGAMEPTKHAQGASETNHSTSLESKAQNLLNELKLRWLQLKEKPGVFSYQLEEERPNRRLPGKYGFLAELNPDRSLKRRAPQTIESLNPTFKPNQFNFNKVNDQEVILTVDKEKDNAEVQMIINKSPLTQFHTLICPEVKSNLVQRVTISSLNFCINFMRGIHDPSVRLGYNSPGALASVNHLHFHLLHLPHSLYIDNVELQLLYNNYVYRLKPNSPTEAICFVISPNDGEQEVRQKIRHIHRLTEWLCENQLPHNLFMTHVRENGDLRVFVFVRSKYCVSKDLTTFNVGFCELAGFLPLSDADKLQNVTQQMVIDRIRDITGDAYKSVYPQVQLITNNTSGSIWWQPFLA